MQVKAGLKKEFMYFWRTFRGFGVLIAFGFVAIVDPFMIRVLPEMLKLIPKDSTSNAAISALTSPTIEMGMASFMGDMMSTGFLVLMLCMMTAAGGEIKKKSTIMSLGSGLTPTNYVLPKFIFYPTFALVFVFLFTMLSYALCVVLFQSTVAIELVMLSGFCLGLYMAFLTTLLLTFGLSTGKAGIGVAVVYVFVLIMRTILMGLDVNHYNPFALFSIAAGMTGGSVADVLISILVTLAVIALLFLLTNSILWDKQVDNRGTHQ